MSNETSRSASAELTERAGIPSDSSPDVEKELSTGVSSEGKVAELDEEQSDTQEEAEKVQSEERQDAHDHDSGDKNTDTTDVGSSGRDRITEPQSSSGTPGDSTASAGDWQAIWSPGHNAYYFANSRTGETTWINPLQPEASTSAVVADASSSAYPSTSPASLYAAAEAAGIDPSLAYLDPSLVMPGTTPAGTFAAKFNARTGAFTRMDARDPSHLSETERAKRMSAVYFDVGAWEQEVEQRVQEEEAAGKKRKRPSKKDLERFKEQKRQKKIAKTAWLRT